ncbi:bifunctional UDP-N-acetylmuramoyl-L-alanyl-D-glutamate--2,6-diaminopimelate ligase MurE/UDP-N-acetylmuramoyl-tripeptide--D-alanyl-D-alanine ligase MurF [Pusillimonas sp. CC-YST705]|uniref:Multifunctional fusion protein n=1 Tax=Mesopusillimonas faecipullorum TaxID=2755040 RepID=A0ABS8C9C4_9BURK|nr:bifunctional UDP-N-acetylmuramoyl-L-alanyl-D-glutamate--2,6-diaminopimelate ligase MurE/UDP-N-acetylmuramoyl-tripeptide--D-alanyl-D-alanine ligase MurF [Mesopusillimonas faecipullorum]MCB5362608.1 bifunctional UDP-N-acetylmuramoyl-L-alanyl-D-glutamate--2,6-diaminopimelate ligase MurE/UDP-N-acetylmuramoyl-tripeptide--D-alanyl-D-alanine ligase MurF [Mesopusillimonas faecipullorum]
MKAHEVLDWLKERVSASAHLHLDSRRLSAGDVFFACPGKSGDGRQHVDEALAQGAAAIVLQAQPGEPVPQTNGVPLLSVPDLSELLGEIAHCWYGMPSEAMTVVATTGTNGKTSVSQWIATALRHDGVPSGAIGTLGMVMPDGSALPGLLTTPDVLSLHRQLAALRAAGAQVVAIEASSIGIEQGRLDGVRIEVAAFTNLTHDHLDYHGTLEAYQDAKFRLFTRPEIRRAVINVDDAAGRALIEILNPAHVFTYSLVEGSTADFRAGDLHTGARGLVFNLLTGAGTAQIVTRVVGRHNISNMLLVAAVLSSLGWSTQRTARVLGELRPVAGRLQTVAWPGAREQAPLVVVDYAHTPDALERALEALRETAASRQGRLWCVFGCGGDRDRGKRPMMGRIAAQGADHALLTSDNPRSENPEQILQDIEIGMMGRRYQVEADRALAILAAVWRAESRDVVLIAGKGHETYQEINGQRQPFDDRVWAELALALRDGVTLETDTRRIQTDQLFLALRGERFDGHDYLETAQAAGAGAAIVERVRPEAKLRQLEVGDTRAALGKLGQAWRARFDLPVIAVTGSNGKTTTKEMIASILRAWQGEEAVLWTRGNLNNELGVPLTLLRLSAEHRAAVVELGMNHPGEIKVLASMAQPTVALVNNAQREHQEFMLSVQAVAQENGSVFAFLDKEGVAVHPGDDEFFSLWEDLSRHCRRLGFGLAVERGVHASDIRQLAQGSVFTLHLPDGEQGVVQLQVPGIHNVNNALAAAACAYAVGVPAHLICAGLENFTSVSGRMQVHSLPSGQTLIDDTYNANPDSVLAAIDVLAQVAGRKVLVLGDMGEVGEQGPLMHAEVGSYARKKGLDVLLTFGPSAELAAQAFGEAAEAFQDMELLIDRLAREREAHILVKGSRSMRMERAVQAMMAAPEQNAEGGHHVA